MTLDKTIQEKKEMSISKWISDKICSYCNVDKKNYQKMKYGIDIIYINISKTAVLIILSVILGIVKETLLLLSVFTCVRLSGFGYHSNNTSILQVLCKYKIVQKNLFKWTELNSVRFYVIRKISTCQ